MHRLIAVAFIALCAPAVHAQLARILPANVLAQLTAEGFLSQAHFDDGPLLFAPQSAALNAAIDKIKAELEPGVTVESLALLPKGANAPRHWTMREKTALFNGMAALSTLAGIRYYSPSRKQTRLFYELSQIIDSPQTQKPLRDPQFTEASMPRTLTLYAKQKDLTFGENVYRYDYDVRDDMILFYQMNLSTMYYSILPVLGEKKLRSIIAVIDAENSLLLYMVSMGGAMAIPGMKNRISLSFKSRSEAILKWFTGKVEAAFTE